MKCIPDPTNRYDRHAVKVVAPTTDEISPAVHTMETRPPPNQQFVRDILGQLIGHVPRNICNLISLSMTQHRNL